MTNKIIRSVYLPASQVVQLERRARVENVSVNEILRQLLSKEFAKVQAKSDEEQDKILERG